jgi:hypothetical protein
MKSILTTQAHDYLTHSKSQCCHAQTNPTFEFWKLKLQKRIEQSRARFSRKKTRV